MDINTFIDTYLAKIQKPAHYLGGEYGSVVKQDAELRFAFCFPDTYDIGMSHLGMKILYHMMNDMEDIACERVFTPDIDMETAMREHGVPLYSLETKTPVKDFDFAGFTLQYELSYSNILNMLDLAGIPFLSTDRGNDYPVVICGGPCACNPAPLADFVDIFFIGEGEEFYAPLFELYLKHKGNKYKFLEAAAELECMYVPAFHDGAKKIKRAIIQDIDNVYYPRSFVVPSAEIVHDRVMLEIMRGCIRGCRFCQAGMIYRPYRQKSPKTLIRQAVELCKNTGYDEISLTSLSTSDFERLSELTDGLLEYCIPQHINLSLPSLRVDNFTKEILDRTQSVRKSGLTFAPEAGTQRLRDVINKNVTDDDIMNTCRIAFENGTSAVKLYFMIGLPTETDEDIAGIAKTAERILHLFSTIPQTKGKGLQITISLATFVPKPFTPFQWEPQISLEEIERKQKYLLSLIKTRKIKVKYHDGTKSVLEGVFARGDRRLGKALLLAWRNGCKLDGWDNHFKFDVWMDAIREAGLSVEEYAGRRRDFNETLPWDIIDIGITKAFLKRECEKAYEAKTTPNCRDQCSGCGVNRLCRGDVCSAYQVR